MPACFRLLLFFFVDVKNTIGYVVGSTRSDWKPIHDQGNNRLRLFYLFFLYFFFCDNLYHYNSVYLLIIYIHHFIFNLKIWTRFYYIPMKRNFCSEFDTHQRKNVICRRFIKRVFPPTSYVENMWRELQKQTWMGHFSAHTNTRTIYSHPASTHSLKPQFNSKCGTHYIIRYIYNNNIYTIHNLKRNNQ